MIDFSQVTDITYNGTTVEQITDSLGNVLWSGTVDPATQYFYVENISGSDNTLSIKKQGDSAPTIEVFKSTNGTNWTSMGTTSTTEITATVPANGKLYLKATANAWGIENYYNSIKCTGGGYYNVGGNIMSLLYSDNFLNQTAFPTSDGYTLSYLFHSNTTLISAENLVLPATTLTKYCYSWMFQGCNRLTAAPVLPATTLGMNCYRSMFQSCTALTAAPALSATTLAEYCYAIMFNGCTGLTETPVLPASILARYCYQQMFYNCTHLSTVITYATNITAKNCLQNWLGNVSATGDFYNLGIPAPTYPSDANGIPSGWTEHNSL